MTNYYEYLQKIYSRNEANNSYALLNDVKRPTLSFNVEELYVIRDLFDLNDNKSEISNKIRKFLAENA